MRVDRVLFALVHFGESIHHEFSRFHLDMLSLPKTPVRERGPHSGTRRGTQAPRGNGKSEITIKIEVLHDVAYGFEEFIVVMAEGASLARDRVREIASEIESNESFRHYYGDLRSEVWSPRLGEIEPNNVRILSKSMGSQVRGVKHPRTGARPSKFILDDAEDSRDVLNPELRARDKRILQEDIEGGGSTDGTTNYQMTGTPLLRDALLPSLALNPAWEFRSYPAIEAWPERMDLWEKCRAVYASAGEGGEGPALARRYYAAHKAEMDRGARVLWPAGEPLIALMLWWWANGDAAFNKEKLLVPRDEGLSTFDMTRAVRHDLDLDPRLGAVLRVDARGAEAKRTVALSNCRIVGFHDPAGADTKAKKGAKADSDFAAIVWVAFETLGPTGGLVGHVFDVWMNNVVGVSKQVEAAFERAEQWRPDLLAIEEDNLALLRESYRSIREKRAAAGLWVDLPIRALRGQQENKTARIATLEPAVTNGWLTFGRNLPRAYLLQFEDHPAGDHDDGPDATEGAWRFRRGGDRGLVEV